MVHTALEALHARHCALAPSEAAHRIRDRARVLGATEEQLVAAGCGVDSIALGATPQTVFRALSTLGPVMALTRNDGCVHERHGRYEHIQTEGDIGIVLGPDIDLRMLFGYWRNAFAVAEKGRKSLQFFDRHGEAIHKVYRTAATDAKAWDALIDRFATGCTALPAAEPLPDPVDTRAPRNATALRRHWLALKDTHEFSPMLRKFGVSRLGALRAAGADLAQQVPCRTAEAVLTRAARDQLPIMCFVANRGIVQIHTGGVRRLVRTGPWFNVLDAAFNLHLNTQAIADCWVVNKPTRDDGWVTSLEVYAASGELIVQFFGRRKPGEVELPAWRALLAGFCATKLAA
ncbi:MAG: ChuX/HutX family heme-like substrate-binding protein [Burkholderiaceae bacterium]